MYKTAVYTLVNGVKKVILRSMTLPKCQYTAEHSVGIAGGDG